jgi:hypothetical protein
MATVVIPPAIAQDEGVGELPRLDPDALLEAEFADLPADPEALAATISADLEALRQLEFRRAIAVSNQSVEDFGRYVDSEMDRSLPADRAAVFGRVVEKLGLYRGPRIDDAQAVLRDMATSQVAAYYDPEASAFRVVIEGAPMSMLAPIYAHELYHGLQDQHWDLDASMAAGLDDDQLFARQAVVEGEATYVMTIWMLERVTGERPSRIALSFAILSELVVNSDAVQSFMTTEFADTAIGAELQASVDAMDDIPPFMIETLMAAYMKGMAFVHTVAGQGWDSVAGLYADPPRSSEQILHPEKFLRRDDPVSVALPDLEAEPALAGWDVLDSNVVGELQFRLIFDEFDFGLRSVAAAAGWDGDRYAVLENESGDLLLLLMSTWDNPAEAEEFAQAYRELLGVKYRESAEPWQVEVRGSDVLIAEGGERERIPGFLEVLGRARLE